MNSNKVAIYLTGIVLFVIQLTLIQIINAGTIDELKGSSGPKVFQAGAATSNITPPLGEGIIAGWTTPPSSIHAGGGLVGGVGDPAEHVNDELQARCLVLDDGETKLVFVVLDIRYTNRELIDEAKRLIHEETNIQKGHIMVSTTHTHSEAGTRADGLPFNNYQKFLIRRIADVVKVANNNLEPARIGWGKGSVPQHVFVRRWKMKPGTPLPNPFGGQDKVRMNPGRNPNLLEPAGKPDPEVSFISVQSTDGRPIALFANYSLHYVGGVPSGHISADYFGVFADRIQELLKADRQNPKFVGIMSNGTSGDVNNINFAAPAENYSSYEKIRIVAEDLAQEVMRVYKTILHHDWVRLQTAQEGLTLKVRKPDRQTIEHAEWVLSRPDTVTPGHSLEKYYAERILQMPGYADNVDIILQTFRIGDLGIAAIPFETFAETGLELKAKSPFNSSFNISLANGSFGYLPPPEQHELGGYETWLSISRVEIDASKKIVAKILELFGKLK